MSLRTAVPGSGGTGDTTGNTWRTTEIDSLPGGWIGDVQVTADQGTFTTATALTSLTLGVTVGTSRRIRVTGYCRFSSDVADDDASLSIYEGATRLQVAIVTMHRVTSAPESYTCIATVTLTPSAGSHTYFLSGARAGGSGNITMTASTTGPAGITVEDLGPA